MTVTVGITLGDINGIGPEIALKAAARKQDDPDVRLALVGSKYEAERWAETVGLTRLPEWTPTAGEPPPLSIWSPDNEDGAPARYGHVTVEAARASALWIREAVTACRTHVFDAMVTAPICKQGWQMAGIDFPGHTEMLAALTDTERYGMLLMGKGLRVMLATRHLPLSRAPGALTVEGMVETLSLLHEGLPFVGCPDGRIGVCGLNPHAGDGGVLGNEEATVIRPAIERARDLGIQAEGPIPADVAFYHAYHGAFDALLAMYHDQGLAPLKMIAFDCGVNITLGLPMIRTSPDHGTAFDLAGRNEASADSMQVAVDTAVAMARRRNPWSPRDG